MKTAVKALAIIGLIALAIIIGPVVALLCIPFGWVVGIVAVIVGMITLCIKVGRS